MAPCEIHEWKLISSQVNCLGTNGEAMEQIHWCSHCGCIRERAWMEESGSRGVTHVPKILQEVEKARREEIWKALRAKKGE